RIAVAPRLLASKHRRAARTQERRRAERVVRTPPRRQLPPPRQRPPAPPAAANRVPPGAPVPVLAVPQRPCPTRTSLSVRASERRRAVSAAAQLPPRAVLPGWPCCSA